MTVNEITHISHLKDLYYFDRAFPILFNGRTGGIWFVGKCDGESTVHFCTARLDGTLAMDPCEPEFMYVSDAEMVRIAWGASFVAPIVEPDEPNLDDFYTKAKEQCAAMEEDVDQRAKLFFGGRIAHQNNIRQAAAAIADHVFETGRDGFDALRRFAEADMALRKLVQTIEDRDGAMETARALAAADKAASALKDEPRHDVFFAPNRR